MTKIKICGLRRPEDILMANIYRPDYVGFVFAKSRRQVTKEEAASLKQMLLPEILAVGVFVNAPSEEILELVREGVIDGIQLHGQETEEEIRYLKVRTSVPVIKAFSVVSQEDLQKCEASSADYVLLDSGAGGTGETFDHKLLERGIRKPFFLAGGMGSDNVREAIRNYHPYAVDVSSKVETDGYKDEEKVRTFIRRVRDE